MRFRLTYEGELFPATNNNPRANHKQEIRKALHPQLKNLWRVTPFLSDDIHPIPVTRILVNEEPPVPPSFDSRIKNIGEKFSLSNYRFVPLVREDMFVSCEIDILFLRPNVPGQIIKSGDIDNRVKTLFDALRRATQKQELGDYPEPEESENPFYCLLEDDRLVSKLSLETDILLKPTGPKPSEWDSRLIITVTIRPHKLTYANMGFL